MTTVLTRTFLQETNRQKTQNVNNLDKQLHQFKDRLVVDVGVEERHLTTICTTIYEELSQLTDEQLDKIEFASPVKLETRIEELMAFNMMMDRVNKQLKKFPEIVRTQVIVQNYIAFVWKFSSPNEV